MAVTQRSESRTIHCGLLQKINEYLLKESCVVWVREMEEYKQEYSEDSCVFILVGKNYSKFQKKMFGISNHSWVTLGKDSTAFCRIFSTALWS